MPNYRSLVQGGFYSSNPADKSVPVSIRTNNPGALNAAVWVKKFPGFIDYKVTTPNNPTVIFEAPEYGVAAWWELLRRYRDVSKVKPFTVKAIIYTYCGKGREKEAVEYTSFVCARAHVTGDLAVDLGDFTSLLPIARAFYRFEAGRDSPLSDDQIRYGFKFARDRATGGQPATPLAAQPGDKPKTPAVAAAGRRAALAGIAEYEGKLKLKWTGPASEAEKYLKPMREPMRKLGQIGKEPIFFNWCASFVTWCCRKAGYAIPNQPTGLNATMALVEAWKYWGKQQGFVIDPTPANLRAGDILLYEWFDGDAMLDHIGVFLRLQPGGDLEAAEGNKDNKTAVLGRDPKNVKMALRLPD